MDLTILYGKSEEEIELILMNSPDLIQDGFQPIKSQKKVITGKIDIFGKDKENKFVVVEIKKCVTGARVMSQIARYMGAIKEEMNLQNEDLYGIIFCQKATMNLKYALKIVSTIRVIEFDPTRELFPPDEPGLRNFIMKHRLYNLIPLLKDLN